MSIKKNNYDRNDLNLSLDRLKNIKNNPLEYYKNLNLKDFAIEVKYPINNKINPIFVLKTSSSYGLLEIQVGISVIDKKDDDLKFKPGDEIEIAQETSKMIIDSISRVEYILILNLKPALFYSFYQCKFKIFQNKKISQIIEETLKIFNIKCKFENPNIDPQMELMIQYYESTWNFLNRCCFLMGSYWFFDNNIIIIGSLNSISKPNIKFKPEFIKDFFHSFKRIGDSGGRINSYDSQNPKNELNFKKESKFHYEEIFSDDIFKAEYAQKMLQFITDSHESESIEFFTNFRLNIFDKITINNKEYYVKEISEHVGSFPNYEKVAYNFTVKITDKLSFKDFEFPKAQTQKATVVLPEKGVTENEIFKDKMERIMVRLHQDEDKNLIPVPMQQQIAFKNNGSSFFPKNNTEIVISFMNGNPNYPIVLGCLYNKENNNIFKIEEFGWNIESLGDSKRNNIINMSILQHKELMKMHSPKDISILSNQGHVFIELLSEENTEVEMKFSIEKGNFNTLINKGNQDTKLKKGDQSTELTDGNILITIEKGNKTIKLEKGNLDIDVTGDINIKASENINLKATEINLDASKISFKAKESIKDSVGINSMEMNTSEITIQSPPSKINISSSQITAECTVSKLALSPAATELQGAQINIQAMAMMSLKSVMIDVSGAFMNIQPIVNGTTIISQSLVSQGAILRGLLVGLWIPG